MAPQATTTQDLARLLTPQEASTILAIEPATLEVWRCTRRVVLPYVKVGRSVRYRASDLAAFIESRTVNQGGVA